MLNNHLLLKVPGIRDRKGWAKLPLGILPGHSFERELTPVWSPFIGNETIRSDIRLAKRSGNDDFEDYGRIGRFDVGIYGVAREHNPNKDWILHRGDEVLFVGNNQGLLQDEFDIEYRWKFIRPRALKLIPSEEEIREMLSNVGHPKTIQSGQFGLRGHRGLVSDIVLITAVSKNGKKLRIAGDSIEITRENLSPPTKHNLKDYIAGLEKLRFPYAGPLPAIAEKMVYPDSPSACIPGRPSLRIELGNIRPNDKYLYFYFKVINDGREIVPWKHYQWSADSWPPQHLSPFAVQGEKNIKLFSIADYYNNPKPIYPGDSANISVCLGGPRTNEEIRVFIPSEFFCGYANQAFMIQLTHGSESFETRIGEKTH
ncbi:MAG: hypothetical protein ACK5ZC_02870 [Pirellulaceae bacterium]|jgi:hypothetical protein